MKYFKSFLASALVAFVATACGEMEPASPADNGEQGEELEQRELLLTLQNKLTTGTPTTRAEIATTDEKRIDALDVYVFGALEIDGEYTFQEKFSYRASGATVAGATAITVQNGNGTSANPTVLLRPKKGLYIKFYCVANHPSLYKLDAAGTAYEEYTTFTPLVQLNPGDPVNNLIKNMGVPTEADFCKLMTKAIDPANAATLITPALPMVGANVTPIDLHDYSLASRLYAGIKLTRAVARFDVVNNTANSRFTLTSVGMINGRSTTTTFPLEAQMTAGGALITYPFRDVTGITDINNGVQVPAFYSYACSREDGGQLVLKGTYQMNQTDTPIEVNYNVDFSQIKNGTGSYIEVNPNNRYLVSITNADPYRVDFTLKVADWEDGGDLGSYVPENSVTNKLITVTGDGTYVEATNTVSIAKTAAKTFTLNSYANADVEAKLIYSATGNEWLMLSPVTMSASDNDLWSKKASITVTVGAGTYTDYPSVILRLINKANAKTTDVKIVGID